jgi:hypothetical protein
VLGEGLTHTTPELLAIVALGLGVGIVAVDESGVTGPCRPVSKQRVQVGSAADRRTRCVRPTGCGVVVVADLSERVSPEVPGDNAHPVSRRGVVGHPGDNFWRDPASGFSDAFFRAT